LRSARRGARRRGGRRGRLREIKLLGCSVHQAHLQVGFDDADALVPDPYRVAAFPAAAPGAPCAQSSARMDAPFVTFALENSSAPFTFFGAGVVVEAPEGETIEGDVTRYFGLGMIVGPPAVADILRTWGIGPVEDGETAQTAIAGAPFVETRSESVSVVGTASLTDRLAPMAPLARPDETNRVYSASGAGLDLRIAASSTFDVVLAPAEASAMP